MKTKENVKNNNFTKLTRSGISLIVLVITITSTYDEVIKTDIKPPKNNIDKKVVSFTNLLLFLILMYTTGGYLLLYLKH